MAFDRLTTIILVVTYIGIAFGRVPGLLIDRTGIAIVGAIALVALGAISIEQATAAIDYSTILLLFGLMIISAQLRVAAFYRLVAKQVLRFAHQPLVLLIGIVVASALLSSVFANDIVCLAFTPVLCEAALLSQRNPLPYLVALATSSNIGSVATLIGNPQNMFIGQISGLSFAHYSLVMIPVALIGLVANVAVIYFVWRKEFTQSGKHALSTKLPEELQGLAPNTYLIKKTLIITGLLLVTFLIGWPREVCALAAAALLLPSRRNPAAKLYALVDWNLIMLFIALFVVIGAMQAHGLMTKALAFLTDYSLNLREPITFVSVCAVLSNLVSNVPAVLLLREVPGESQRLWYLLAMASTLAGNLTLLGSIANLIVAEKAAPFGIRISFIDYAKAGVPLTIITLLLGSIWVLYAT